MCKRGFCFTFLAPRLTLLQSSLREKGPVFGVILVRIFRHSDENNSKHGPFLRSDYSLRVGRGASSELKDLQGPKFASKPNEIIRNGDPA